MMRMSMGMKFMVMPVVKRRSEGGDNSIVGGAGVRYANAKQALEDTGYHPYWDEASGKWVI
jgi:hypothetical protein